MPSTSSPGGGSPRVVAPERLDSLPPEDPLARRARRDLQRVHRAMRSLGILLDAVGRLHLRAPPRRILELGAGDGTLLLRLLRALRRRWPGGEVALLDRAIAIDRATIAAFAALGWNVKVLRTDALEWARAPHHRQYDLCLTTLFLHHLQTPELTDLLAAVSASSGAFIACEPRRNAFSRLGSRLIGVLGASELTREDAVTSVDAGFAGRELTPLWPAGDSAWRLGEYLAWPFTHCFVARRAIEPTPHSR